ncbi:MAG: T9SS type A sorting domain-containing protein [Flavobacteriaceae bacterium]|nr:T9SS type A sorting domain-containing protein [Bacteroidia bacterium]NNK88513.1 T9SS type A sorting domain-containing protein [Flavobacteriaceae bacterium]
MFITTSKKCAFAYLSFILMHVSFNSFGMSFGNPFDDMAWEEEVFASDLDERAFQSTENCGETAFAFLNQDDDPTTADMASNCFIPEFNRWGWTTLLDFSEETGQSSYTLDIYAGAGQCDLSKGTDVGSVIITYNEDSSVTFEYSLEGFVLSEAHIYIGQGEYPIDNSGEQTVAPGQYTFTDSDFEPAQDYSVTIPVEGTLLYVIIHGVTSHVDCDDSNDDCPDADADGVCDPDDICPGFDDTADSDGDGIPDGCDDDCPDSDGDGVCDSDDICPGHNDNADNDGDGIPDGCDNGAFEAPAFSVYPVPFQGEVNVRYAFNYETAVNIEIFDTKGIKLAGIENSNYIQGSTANTKLDLSYVRDQLLFVRLTTAKGQVTKKIISFKSRPVKN